MLNSNTSQVKPKACMQVKWKIISLIMLIVLAACTAFIYLIVAQDKKNLHEDIAREVKSIKSLVNLLEEDKYKTYQLRIRNFINAKTESSKTLLKAFAKRDRDTLLAKSTPFLQFLNKENPHFSTLVWITKDNRHYLRVHLPDAKTSDDISEMRPDVVEANKTHSQISSYKVGKNGLQYRVVQPVDYKGEHIGAVQFGIDSTLLLESIHEKLKMPVALVLANDKAKIVTHPMFHSWNGSNHTLYSKQLDIFQLNDVPINWALDIQKISHQGRSYQLVRVFDFLGYSQETEGSLFVALETTQRESELSKHLVLMAFISGTVLFFSFLVLYSNYNNLSYRNLIGTIETLNSNLQKQNATLETTVKQRTASMQQSDERFSQLASLTFIGILLHQQGVALEVNESLVTLTGYSRDELIGQNLIDLLIPEEHQKEVRMNIALEQPEPYECLAKRKDGSVLPVEIESRNVDDENGSYRVTAIRDISQRKQVENKYELLVQEASLGIALADAETGILVECNDALLRMIKRNRHEVIGQPQSKLHPPQSLIEGLTQRFVQNRDGHPNRSPHNQLITKGGTLVDTEIRARKIEYNGREMMLGIFQDVTEKLKLEEQLRQKYKMEAIGVMAGGIAHNFNNSLAIVLGNLEMAQRKFSQADKVKSFIENAKIATLRSRDLVNQIMTYSRKGVSKEDAVSLTVVVDEIQKLVSSTLPTTIHLNINISPQASQCRINADSGRVQEAILNLCNNAVQAMDEKGDLSFSLEKVTLDQQEIPAQYHKCQPGTYVLLSVNDTGCGMDQETISKIFDPFFTTKEVDQGTGMGLASVQGIMDQHNGLIKVHSTLGQGSTFELFFPVLDTFSIAPQSEEEIPPVQGAESVLFVDDDPMIIDLGKQMLGDIGYNVVTAFSGTEALAIMVDDPQRFELIITDQTMPKMTGHELAQEIRKLNPDVPIILSTGYSSKIREEDIEKYGISAYCNKPLRLNELSQVIRGLLDG